MLDAFKYLLCSKLCWHNRPVPKDEEYEEMLRADQDKVRRI